MKAKPCRRAGTVAIFAIALALAGAGAAYADSTTLPCQVTDYPDVTVTPPYQVSADLRSGVECFGAPV